MKKLLSILVLSLLFGGSVFAKEVKIICFKDGLKDNYSLVQIDEEKNRIYWDDFKYDIVDGVEIWVVKQKGTITGHRDGVLIFINRYTFKGYVQNTKDNTLDIYNCKKEEKLF